VVCGPGATGTDARIHTKLRIADVSIGAVEVTDVTGGETFKRFTWEQGELVLADRAYCSPSGVQHVLDAQADVLVRFRLAGIELHDARGNPIDVLAQVAHLSVGKTLDLDVDAKLSRRMAPGRLIAYCLPDDAVERAHKRLRRELGSVSAQVMEAAKYVLLFTTAKRGRLDAERCLQAYRLRWQIEICHSSCGPCHSDLRAREPFLGAPSQLWGYSKCAQSRQFLRVRGDRPGLARVLLDAARPYPAAA
jgi:hypothetical protein